MRQSSDYRRGRYVVSALNVHLVFVTKYQCGVLTAEHLEALREVFTSVCGDFGAELVEMEGEDDHVQLLVAYPPTIAVARLVNSLKGVSARRLRQRYRVRTHREHLWSPSYFAASAGDAPLKALKAYIRQQRTSGPTPSERRGPRPQEPRHGVRIRSKAART
jgi:REP-associated tyrosine transposase